MGQLAEEQCSSPGHSTIEHVLNHKLVFDYCAYKRLQLAYSLCSCRLNECYDRIVHSASLALQRTGISQSKIIRDVIYGPHELGGLNFTDMKVEQLSQHVHRLIGNVRKGGNLCKIILMTINAYQLHLGSERPFLSQDPKAFPHRQPRATSCLTYIWEALREIQGHINIPGTWCPSKANGKDEAIIDAVLRTIQAKTPNLVKDTIWMVNACRLYLKVTMLSEILDTDGICIQQWAMNGTQQSTTVLEYPFQPRPPPHAWKIWRDALHATYLDKYRDAHRAPLHRPIGPPSPTPIAMTP